MAKRYETVVTSHKFKRILYLVDSTLSNEFRSHDTIIAVDLPSITSILDGFFYRAICSFVHLYTYILS